MCGLYGVVWVRDGGAREPRSQRQAVSAWVSTLLILSVTLGSLLNFP